MSNRVYKIFIVTVRIVTVFQVAYLAFLFVMRDQMRSDAFHGAFNDEPTYMASNLSEMTGIDFQDSSGCTLLMYASKYGKRANIEYLLEHGADRSIRNGDGETAYDIALEEGQHIAFRSEKHRMDYQQILTLVKP